MKMKIGNSVEEFTKEFSCCVATIGNFDGLHLGHRSIMDKVKERARINKCPALVITFEPHPSSILFPTRTVSRLASAEQKIEFIEQCEIDGILILPFTLAFAQKGPRTFVEEILNPLKIKELYVGHDFSFGSGRSGNVKALSEEGKLLDFKVFEIDEVTIDGEPVRSTYIRKFLAEGDVVRSAKLLNRYHSLIGTVIKGAGRGSTMNFPTANLAEPKETVPSAGVYATKTKWKGKLYDSATHVGVIPTFDVDVPGIETHIFNFNETMTGDDIEIFFIKKIRDTTKFDSIDELTERIRLDCEETKKVLKNECEETYLPR